MTLAEALRRPVVGDDVDLMEARILLGHVAGLARVQLVSQSERVLSADEELAYRKLLARRAAGEPVAYLVGTREFYGRPFRVTPDVLIPRPETELLVELAVAQLAQLAQGAQARVLDLGTGSGAIAVSVACECPAALVTALDVSSPALDIARANAQALGARVEFLQSDWFTALAGRQFDLIVANPPYIAAGDLHLSQGDLRYEPQGALTDGRDGHDGLGALRNIVAGAAGHLAADGWVLMEHGYDQAEAVRTLLHAAGFAGVQSWNDLAGIPRVSGGRRAPQA